MPNPYFRASLACLLYQSWRTINKTTTAIGITCILLSFVIPSLRTFVLLGRLVGLIPIALSIPPQSGEGQREFRRRIGFSE